jgi:hypothetical protein
MNIATITEKIKTILASFQVCKDFASLELELPVDVLVGLELVGLELVGLELLEDVPLALELLVEAVLVEVDALLNVPKVPPWTAAGSELPLTFAAAALNKARVSWPLVLKKRHMVSMVELVTFDDIGILTAD